MVLIKGGCAGARQWVTLLSHPNTTHAHTRSSNKYQEMMATSTLALQLLTTLPSGGGAARPRAPSSLGRSVGVLLAGQRRPVMLRGTPVCIAIYSTFARSALCTIVSGLCVCRPPIGQFKT